MKKLELALDSLSIESFETGAAPRPGGTVEAQGQACTDPATCKCPTSIWACRPPVCELPPARPARARPPGSAGPPLQRTVSGDSDPAGPPQSNVRSKLRHAPRATMWLSGPWPEPRPGAAAMARAT